MDDSSRGALTAAGLSCGSCGTELPPNSKFCNECGTPVAPATQSAEYKQVTVFTQMNQDLHQLVVHVNPDQDVPAN